MLTHPQAVALAGITGVPRDDQPKIVALLHAAGTSDVEVWTGAALCPPGVMPLPAAGPAAKALSPSRRMVAAYAERARLDLVQTADKAGRQVLGPIVVTELPRNPAGSRVWQARALTVPVDVVRLDLAAQS